MKTKIFLVFFMVVASTLGFAQTTIYPTLSAGVTINDASTSYDYYLVGQVLTTEPNTYGIFYDLNNPHLNPGNISFYTGSGIAIPKPDPLEKTFYTIRVTCIRVYNGTTTEYDRRSGSSLAGLDANNNLYAIDPIVINF
jgi:hypothetical protein